MQEDSFDQRLERLALGTDQLPRVGISNQIEPSHCDPPGSSIASGVKVELVLGQEQVSFVRNSIEHELR